MVMQLWIQLQLWQPVGWIGREPSINHVHRFSAGGLRVGIFSKKFLCAENVLILLITKVVLNGLDPLNF